MERINNYLNPIERLGKRQYSFFFPLTFSLIICLVSELFAFSVAKNPDIVGNYIIWINIATIIYFAFRDGIRGGFIATCIPILYYFYIIYTRHYSGQRYTAGIDATIILAGLYLLIAYVIGWLKQKIDTLIESESNEKRRLQTIVEQLPVGIAITDNQGRIVNVNKRLEKIFGMKVPLGSQVRDQALLPTTVKGKKIYKPSEGALAQVLAHEKPVIAKEFTVTRKDGKVVFLQTSASPIHNANGKLIAAASITIDVTQQKELEKRKDDFVNMASHELKTPITSMGLYIDSLMLHVNKNKDEKTLMTLGKIRQQTKRLQGLVNDLLDVSRLQTGKLGFDKEVFRLDSLVKEIVDDMQDMAKQQEIIFKGNGRLNVYADKFRIYQVLTNLISNAVKYSPTNEKHEIIVKIKKNADKVMISVQDHGIGIAKEQQKRVFERLYQVNDDKQKSFPGFGMGLYISKEIIKRHNGTIWVESEGKSEDVLQQKRGSTFFFTLPLTNK